MRLVLQRRRPPSNFNFNSNFNCRCNSNVERRLHVNVNVNISLLLLALVLIYSIPTPVYSFTLPHSSITGSSITINRVDYSTWSAVGGGSGRTYFSSATSSSTELKQNGYKTITNKNMQRRQTTHVNMNIANNVNVAIGRKYNRNRSRLTTSLNDEGEMVSGV